MAVMLALLASVAFACGGDYLGRRWVETAGWRLLALGGVAHVTEYIFWLGALKHRPHLGQMATVWCIVVALVDIALGAAFFGERMTRTQWLGVVLGLASLPLLGGE